MTELPVWMQDGKRGEQAKREYALQTHDEQTEAFEHISALIEEVRRCWTSEDYRTVQQHVGEHIERVDAAVGSANRRLARAEKQLRRSRQKDLPLDSKEVMQAQSDLDRAGFDRELYLRLGRQYRTLGDAIAWQFYGFRALPIYSLGMNTSPGILSSSKRAGADAEEEAIERLWREKRAFALRHDYTNCLRVWDLSVLYPEHPDSPDILEIKVAGRSISPRQKRKGQRAIELVGHQVTTSTDGTVLVHWAHTRRTPDGAPATTLDLLWRALLAARSESVGMTSNTYLAVKAMDMTRERTLEQVMHDWPKWEEIPPEIESPACADYLIGNSYQKKAEVGFVAPYSIYPLPASYAAGLITGYIRVRTQLNTAALTKALQNVGFEAECLLERYRLPGQSGSELEGTADYFRLSRGPITILISGQPLGQILFEGLPLEDFVASVVDNYEALSMRKGIIVPGSPFGGMHRIHALSTYTNMEQVWRTSREFIEPYEGDCSHTSYNSEHNGN